MELVLIGKIVNTHGIKGELRLLSDFEYKERIFKKGSKIYINKEEYIINSYRYHKIFDMITLNGYTNINDVLFLKGKKVYCKREDLNLKSDEYLIQDLIGIEVYFNENLVGKVTDISRDKNPLITIDNKKFVPYNDNFIDSIDIEKGKIELKNCEGLLWR